MESLQYQPAIDSCFIEIKKGHFWDNDNGLSGFWERAEEHYGQMDHENFCDSL